MNKSTFSARKNKITANNVLFIKLGKGGEFDKDCIENNHTLKLDYREVDHQLCMDKKWKEVNTFLMEEGSTKSAATNHVNQIMKFYEEDENTLWITFYANKLWWCFAKSQITLNKDNTKTRPASVGWSDKDIEGNPLRVSSISGKLLKTQGFRGTICKVHEIKYVLAKINNEKLKEVVAVEKAMKELKYKLEKAIKLLQWQDFEILIDLIFRQGGWQRLSDTGKTQKFFDLDLLSPVTDERAIVQIKAQSDSKEFEKYLEAFKDMEGDYDKFFYVTHSSDNNFKFNYDESKIKLYFVDKVAELAISAGLVEWILKKAF